MSTNRTNRGVLILMCILALIVVITYLGRMHLHPLEAETHLKVETNMVQHVDSTNVADSIQSSSAVRRKKSGKTKHRNRKKNQRAGDLPSPHDSPIAPIK